MLTKMLTHVLTVTAFLSHFVFQWNVCTCAEVFYCFLLVCRCRKSIISNQIAHYLYPCSPVFIYIAPNFSSSHWWLLLENISLIHMNETCFSAEVGIISFFFDPKYSLTVTIKKPGDRLLIKTILWYYVYFSTWQRCVKQCCVILRPCNSAYTRRFLYVWTM